VGGVIKKRKPAGPVVKVFITSGCPLCGKKTEHTHPWSVWETFVHGSNR
jgi:hypothetical protein